MRDPVYLSVITVVRNAQSEIEETLQSVLDQCVAGVEYLVIDGASTDGTSELISRYASRLAHFTSEPDGGLYDAMNKGAAKASGLYLAFLNAGDRYLPGALQGVVQQLKLNSAAVLYAHLIHERVVNGRRVQRPVRPRIEQMEREMGIFHPATFMRRDVFETLGGFNTHYSQAADYELLLRAWLRGYSFVEYPQATTVFALGGVTSTGCTTYREALEILQSYQLPSARRMKGQLALCRRKQLVRSLLRPILKLPVVRKYWERKLLKSWS